SRDGTVKTLITQATHCSTHVNTWKRHRTHTHTRRPEVVVNLVSAFSHPGLSFLQDPRSSGQLLSARGPSQVNCASLVRDGHVFCSFWIASAISILLAS